MRVISKQLNSIGGSVRFDEFDYDTLDGTRISSSTLLNWDRKSIFFSLKAR